MVGDSVSFGERLQQLRLRAGLTRPVLGGLVGRSTGWVKAVETVVCSRRGCRCCCDWPRCCAWTWWS